MHSGGKTIQLNAGHYQAKIVTVGAGLAERPIMDAMWSSRINRKNTHGASREMSIPLAQSRDKWLLLL